jgi:hypothetical protein
MESIQSALKDANLLASDVYQNEVKSITNPGRFDITKNSMPVLKKLLNGKKEITLPGLTLPDPLPQIYHILALIRMCASEKIRIKDVKTVLKEKVKGADGKETSVNTQKEVEEESEDIVAKLSEYTVTIKHMGPDDEGLKMSIMPGEEVVVTYVGSPTSLLLNYNPKFEEVKIVRGLGTVVKTHNKFISSEHATLVPMEPGTSLTFVPKTRINISTSASKGYSVRMYGRNARKVKHSSSYETFAIIAIRRSEACSTDPLFKTIENKVVNTDFPQPSVSQQPQLEPSKTTLEDLKVNWPQGSHVSVLSEKGSATVFDEDDEQSSSNTEKIKIWKGEGNGGKSSSLNDDTKLHEHSDNCNHQDQTNDDNKSKNVKKLPVISDGFNRSKRRILKKEQEKKKKILAKFVADQNKPKASSKAIEEPISNFVDVTPGVTPHRVM